MMYKILKLMLVWLKSVCIKLDKDNSSNELYKFLTPNDKAEKIEEYSKALTEALGNGKVKNIAISGSYGSGKSSFIKTFEKNNPKYDFLDISLAKFDKQDKSDTDLSLIEKSILEQIFYKVSNSKIPQSRLNKINRLKGIWVKVFGVLLSIISLVIILDPKYLNHIKFIKNIAENEQIQVITTIILFIAIAFLIRRFILLTSNINVKQLSLQNIELQSNNENESLLNKYLDEILYFFEKTNFGVVVFQDLDRFENLDIFTKLRELNNFINNSDQVNKKVVFIYATKDEIFTDQHQRTKFFDFLIPIIPYINTSNSKDMLVDNFKEIDKSFLYDISLYIADIRLLNNIYNEFRIYKNNLESRLDKTKLLAMIIYKNFEPQDFNSLHKSEGLVFDIFNKKENYIANNIKVLDEKISDIKSQIKEINNEPRLSIKELRKIFIFKIIEKLNNFKGYIYIDDNNNLTIEQSCEDENFKKIQESINISYDNYNSGNISFDEVNENNEYKKREQLILDKANDKVQLLNKEINAINLAKQELKNLNIQQIIENYDSSVVFDDKFKNKNLLKYLISYGHIEENYSLYMSNFLEKTITKNELDFILNIKNNNKHFSFDYGLKNIEEVAKHRLIDNEFKRESVLNFDLIEYILENSEDYQNKLKILFKQLSNNSQTSQKFIFEFIKKYPNNKLFLETILQNWNEVWSYFSDEEHFDIDARDGLVKNALDLCDKDVLLNSNKDNTLYKSISMFANWVKLNQNQLSNLKYLIKELNIKFAVKNLSQISNKDLFDYIYDGNYYIIYVGVFNEVIYYKLQENKGKIANLSIAHLTTINNSKLDTMQDYINDNINDYIENVFLRINTNTKESEKTIIDLLNNEELQQPLKVKIIKSQNGKIIDIGSIKDQEFWHILFENNKIITDWKNVSRYYNFAEKLDDYLIDYLNVEENSKKLSLIRVDKSYCEENTEFNTKLLREIIENNNFELENYENLIKNIGYWYKDLNIDSLDDAHIVKAIECNIFQFEKECFNDLKSRDGNLHIKLIEKNIDSLIENFDKFDIDTDDLIEILQLEEISEKIQIEVVENADVNLVCNNIIAKLVYYTVDKNTKQSLDLIKNILKHLESEELQVKLLLSQNKYLDDDEFLSLLEQLPLNYSKISKLDGKQSVLFDNNDNKQFIKLLHERRFITKDKKDKKNMIRVFIKKVK